MNDIVLYECFGYTVKLLEKHHGTEIFKLLKEVRLNRNTATPEMFRNDRARLKGEIRTVLSEKRYNPIGLYDKNKLIGISFSSVLDDEKEPWLGWFYINPDYRNTKASVVLINYLINILYYGFTIQIGATGNIEYEKLITTPKNHNGYYVFKNNVGDRLKRICTSSGSEKVYEI